MSENIFSLHQPEQTDTDRNSFLFCCRHDRPSRLVRLSSFHKERIPEICRTFVWRDSDFAEEFPHCWRGIRCWIYSSGTSAGWSGSLRWESSNFEGLVDMDAVQILGISVARLWIVQMSSSCFLLVLLSSWCFFTWRSGNMTKEPKDDRISIVWVTSGAHACVCLWTPCVPHPE